MSFVRNLDAKIIGQLKEFAQDENSLFARLCEEAKLKDKAVFPAVRNNRIDFYYLGGKLFSFKGNDFSTHHKYASVITNIKGDYIKQSQLETVEIIKNFIAGYTRIKENCALYAGVEAEGVSYIYGKYSYFTQNPIVVLDIEIALANNEREEEAGVKKTDRIDLLFFDKETATLKFYEAKHFSNKELWATVGNKPQVVSQINRYEEQLRTRNQEILAAYQNYVKIINDLFNLKLALPKKIDKSVGLLIFGFDKNQLEGRFKNLLLDDGSLSGIGLYAIGDVSGADIKNVWRNTKIQP